MASRFAGQSFTARSELRIDEERQSIRSMLASALSCSKSLTTATLNTAYSGTGFINLLDASGNVLVARNGTKIGDLTVAAYSNAATKTLDIRAAMPRRGGASNYALAPTTANFFPHPLTGVPLSWQDPKAALFPDRGPCQSHYYPPDLSVVSGPLGINPPGGVCQAAPTNWSRFVQTPFTPHAATCFGTFSGWTNTSSYFVCNKATLLPTGVLFSGQWGYGGGVGGPCNNTGPLFYIITEY
jgi:hypothetical protein